MIEQVSIDEAYLDVTATLAAPGVGTTAEPANGEPPTGPADDRALFGAVALARQLSFWDDKY